MTISGVALETVAALMCVAAMVGAILGAGGAYLVIVR